MDYLQRLYAWLRRLMGDELDDRLKRYFLSGAYKSLRLQGAIAALTFLTALFIARTTGEEGFGIYSTVFTWVAILSVGATLGLDDLALKQLPLYQAHHRHDQIRGFLRWSNGWGLLSGVGVAAATLLVARATDIKGLSNYWGYYCWAVWVIPLFVLMHVNQAALRGLQQIGRGQLAEKVVQPLAFFVLLVGCYYWQGVALTDLQAVIARLGAFMVTAVAAFYLLYKGTQAYQSATLSYEKQRWWRRCRYFGLTSILYIFHTRMDIIWLSYYETAATQIAHYNAALKLSDLALIPFAVLYRVTAPMFSILHAEGDWVGLQLFYTMTTRLSFGLIASILLGLLLLGHWLLGWFGPGFRQGYPMLMILCGVKLLHVFVGPVNYLLMMVDLEREATGLLLLTVIATTAIHHWWVPLYGTTGAAWGTFAGTVLFELGMVVLAYRKAGIMPTVLGRFFQKKQP